MIVNVWEWRSGAKLASNKVSARVKAISFAENGAYFVTVGNRHVKFWYLECARLAKVCNHTMIYNLKTAFDITFIGLLYGYKNENRYELRKKLTYKNFCMTIVTLDSADIF